MNIVSLRNGRLFLIAGLSIGVLGFAACTAPGTGTVQQGDTVKIGAILPLTGPMSEWGESNAAVLEMFEEEVNADGGVNNKDFELVIYDSEGKPAEAANLVRKLATDDEVLAIIGPFTSSEAEVAFPVANQLKIPATAQASSKPGVAEENRPWAFRNTVDESAYLQAVVPAMAKEINAQQVAITHDSADAVSVSIGEVILPAVLADTDLEVMNSGKSVTFTTEDIDLRSQVGRLAALSPDAIGVGAPANGAAKLLREMSNRGVQIPIFGGSTLVSSTILEAAPKTAIFSAGTYYPGHEGAAHWTEKVKAAFEERGVPGEPTMFDSQLYEIGQMYVEAIKTGDLESQDLGSAREGVRDFMTQLKDFPGLTSEISMQESGDTTREFFVIKGLDGAWSVLETTS